MRSKRKLNRRQFIGAVGAGVAVTGCAANSSLPNFFPPVASEDTDSSPRVEASAILPNRIPVPLPDTQTILLNRITYGPRAADVAEINSLGYSACLERQLNPESIDDSQMAARLAPFTTLSASATALSSMDSMYANELGAAAVLRSIYSKRQLYEKMVEFWSDHFNVNQFASGIWYLKTVEDREVIRPYAMGRFKDLLRASAKSPAMLRFLSGEQNRAEHPNENYAREVMELHTLGVNGGYTQQDVQAMARAMTGWTIGTSGSTLNAFEFRADYHDNGAKQIMGLSLPAGGGITDGERALDYLALHPTTSQTIAGKLVAFFVSEDRPQALVDQAALTFRLTGGDIKATLRTALSESSMLLATPKVKRPFHLLADITRRSDTYVSATMSLAQIPGWMGHQPFSWSMPDGFPQRSDYWAPGLLSRWNLMMTLAGGNVEGVPIAPYYIGQSNGAESTDQVIALWNQKFFGGQMSAADQQALANYVNVHPDNRWRKYNESFALALSLPAFQYH